MRMSVGGFEIAMKNVVILLVNQVRPLLPLAPVIPQLTTPSLQSSSCEPPLSSLVGCSSASSPESSNPATTRTVTGVQEVVSGKAIDAILIQSIIGSY